MKHFNFNRKYLNFKSLLILLVITLLLIYYLGVKVREQKVPTLDNTTPSPSPILFKKSPDPDNVICTADVIQCPDGSYVGRIAPSCSFAQCPKKSKYTK